MGQFVARILRILAQEGSMLRNIHSTDLRTAMRWCRVQAADVAWAGGPNHRTQ